MGFLSRGFQDLATLSPTVKDINFDFVHIPLLQQHNLLLYMPMNYYQFKRRQKTSV